MKKLCDSTEDLQFVTLAFVHIAGYTYKAGRRRWRERSDTEGERWRAPKFNYRGSEGDGVRGGLEFPSAPTFEGPTQGQLSMFMDPNPVEFERAPLFL